MSSADAPDPLVGSVLFVCTGKVCRSPYAERLLAHFVPGLPVASAGIAALAGPRWMRPWPRSWPARGHRPTASAPGR